MIGKRKLFFIALALVTLGLLISCQSATPTLVPASQPGVSVGISDDTCPTMIVKGGQQVSWTNQGKQDHIVREISAGRQSQFDSGTLKPGDSFAITLPQPQTYQYECSADGSLTGTITVEP